MTGYLDKMPPVSTGDVRKDLRETMEYLIYLQEQMNFILSKINKQLTN